MIRNAQLSDDQAILDIWQDNAPQLRAIPTFANAIPDWTLAIVRKRIVNMVANGTARAGVYTPTVGGQVQAFLFGIRQPNYEEALIWLIRLVRRANGSINQAASETRFRTAMTELLEGWFRSAKAAGITQCAGYYPLDGFAASLAFLDAMTTRNGVQPDLTSRPGWRGYVVTPDQGIIGLGLVP